MDRTPISRNLGRVLAILAIAAAQPSVAQSPSVRQASFDKGVRACAAGKYAAAASLFEAATAGQANSDDALRHLAAARTWMCKRFVGPLPISVGKKAEEALNKILSADSHDASAITAMGVVKFFEAAGNKTFADNLPKLDEARTWFERALAQDPSRPDTMYALAVVDFHKAFSQIQARMKPAEWNGPITDPNRRREMGEVQHLLEGAITRLNRLTATDRADSYALTYLSLALRQKALFAPDAAEYHREMDAAEEFFTRALDASKPAAGLKAAQTCELSAGIGYALEPPPPPPPPPPPRGI